MLGVLHFDGNVIMIFCSISPYFSLSSLCNNPNTCCTTKYLILFQGNAEEIWSSDKHHVVDKKGCDLIFKIDFS